MKRRICWPEFDVVCLQGGCLWCNDNEFRTITTIREAIPEDRDDLWDAFNEGRNHDWRKAQVKK